jgi:hypothetical protein
MAYRMTPARRAALRRAQAASARKRKGKGKGKSRISPRTRRRVKAGAKLAGAVAIYAGANAAGIALAHHQGSKRRAATHRRNRAANEHMIRRHTGTSPRTVLHGARAHGGGPTSANRIFATSRHGTTSVRRRHH